MKWFRMCVVFVLTFLCILPVLTGCQTKGIKQYKMKVYENIAYKTVDHDQLLLDIEMPTVRKYEKNPVVFYFHGGSWISGDKKAEMDFMRPAIEKIRKNGVAVIGVNYRFVNADLKYPAPVVDCIDAIRWAVSNADKYDLDIDKMGSWGMSAGGYLALMTGFAEDAFITDATNAAEKRFKLHFVVDLCGPAVFDVASLDGYSAQAIEVMQNFIGGSYQENHDKYLQASPTNYLTKNNPNLLIIHGEQDEFVPISQAETLLVEAKKAGVPAELIKVKNARHTFGAADGGAISPTMDTLYTKIADFIIANTRNTTK